MPHPYKYSLVPYIVISSMIEVYLHVLQDNSTNTDDLCAVVQDEGSVPINDGYEVDDGGETEKYDSDPINDGYEVDDGDENETYDSDATTLDLEITPRSSTQFNVGTSGESSTSFESVYETDPDYSGPPPQSQPCQKHGVSYVPAGLRRKLIKKRKLNFDNCQ